jgi:cytidylate kinase
MAIITVSRGSMSGGEALARAVSEALGYPMLGRDVLVAAASSLGVSEETLSRKFEKSPGLWGRLTSDRRLYVVAVQAALAEKAASGNLVYHGHAGHMLLRGVPCVLRVRLIAPLEMRVQAVVERQGLSREAAIEYIRNIDEDRIRWTKFIYGVDWSDPSIYDLVVNLERMSLGTACAVVTSAVGRAEYAATDEVKRQLADFVLASRVKLALATHPQTRNVELNVRSEGGVIEVAGDMPNAEFLTRPTTRGEDELRDTARSVDGVKDVHLQIRWFDPYH